MKPHHLPLIILLAAMGVVSCRLSKHLPLKKLDQTQESYLENYGQIPLKLDTVIVDAGISRKYKEGRLFQIGPINKTGNPKGYWFEFGSSRMVEYVYHYKGSKIDTFIRPLSVEMLNYNW